MSSPFWGSRRRSVSMKDEFILGKPLNAAADGDTTVNDRKEHSTNSTHPNHSTLGQQWHVVSFNNAPVLHALLGEELNTSEDFGDGDNGGGKADVCDSPSLSPILGSMTATMSFQEALEHNDNTLACKQEPEQVLEQEQEQEQEKQQTNPHTMRREFPKPSSSRTFSSSFKPRKKTIPPLDYVCKLCSKTGHWMEDCHYYRPHTIQLDPESGRAATGMGQARSTGGVPPPPPNYLCRLCSIPGHWIDQCPKFTPKVSSPRRSSPYRHGR